MKAGLVTGQQRFELVEMAEPEPTPGKAVVDISLCGVCGTDIHGFLAAGPYNPAICGHEWVGHVSALGSGISNVAEGDRVVISVLEPCGSCAACQAGREQYCAPKMLSMVGRDEWSAAHGGFAPRLAFDARRLMHVPARLSDVQAAIVEPATVALHAVRRTPPDRAETVVVQGCGPIGLLAIQCLRALGAEHVIAVEPVESRRTLALACGAHIALTPTEAFDQLRSHGADVVFECAGAAPAVQAAAELCRLGGVLNLVGLASGAATITPGTWLRKELTMIGSLGYDRHEFARCLDLIVDGMAVELVNDRTVALDQLPEAIERLAADSTSAVKLLVDPR